MKKIFYALLIGSFVLSNSLFSQANLVISEFMFNSPNPGFGDNEYIEIYNNDSVPVNLDGYYFSQGINYSFDSLILNVGSYIVLTNDSDDMVSQFGVNAIEWTSGTLSNNGEDITFHDSTGLTIDSIDYEPASPWPIAARGVGASVELCYVDSNNIDPKFWQRSITRGGFIESDRLGFGSPGSANSCVAVPIIQHQFYRREYAENAGTVSLNLIIDNNTALTSTTFQITAVNISALVSSDISFSSPSLITVPAGTDTVMSFSFDVVDDTIQEADEKFMFILHNASNGAVFGTDTITITITENDEPTDKDLILVGIYEGNNNLGAKGLEIYVSKHVTDLSKYGLGTANNGGGTDGIEYNFPAIAIGPALIFVASDSALFRSFFGFDADFIDNNAINFTGDDAVELYEHNTVIDVFGEIDVDGTGEVWEYTDGWAHRVNHTGPDGDVFDTTHWFYSGIDVFDGVGWNDSASSPYPLGIYTPLSVSKIVQESDQVGLYPNPASSSLWLSGLNSSKVQFKIFNINGQLKLEGELPEDENEIDVSRLNRGIYLVQIIDLEKGNVENRKLLIER